MNSFSVIIPANGIRMTTEFFKLKRAVDSIATQVYDNWECIIVNDGNVDLTWRDKISSDSRIRVVNLPHRMNRAIARNVGMEEAKNDWICWLDSDDAYMPMYFYILNQQIEKFPEFKLFNYGGIIFGREGPRDKEVFSMTKLREPFVFKDHSKFKSGKIATGHFTFHKDAYKDVGEFPPVTNCYALGDAAKEEFPEMIEWYGPKYREGGKELGNPWGDDYYYFYKLTRKYKSKQLPFHLYVQYPRV